MTTYIRYQCDACHREIESELDPIRPSLNKCNITYKCEGKLVKIGEKKLRSELVPLPQAGVDNWRQRGTELISREKIAEPVWVTALSSENYISVAVKRTGAAPGITHQIHILLNLLSNSVRPFVEYTYTLAPLTKIVTGLDANSKNLRFTVDDEVFVYVNGVKQYSLDPDTSYHATLGTYNKDFDSNSIKFKNALVDSSTVKVVVYGVLSHVTYDLTAVHDVNLLSTWGNIKTVSFNETVYDVYQANVLNMPINYYFSLRSVMVGNATIPNDNVKLLMSERPFTALSRWYDKWLPFNDKIKFNKVMVDEIIDIKINADTLIDVFPLIRPTPYTGYPDTITGVAGFKVTQPTLSSINTNGPAV